MSLDWLLGSEHCFPSVCGRPRVPVATVLAEGSAGFVSSVSFLGLSPLWLSVCCMDRQGCPMPQVLVLASCDVEVV